MLGVILRVVFVSVYNGTRQYKDKMDLAFLQSNQVQLSAKEKKKLRSTTQIKCFTIKL